MKFTVNIDPVELDDASYAELIQHVLSGMVPWLWPGGNIGFTHDWDTDKQYQRKWSLSELTREAATTATDTAEWVNLESIRQEMKMCLAIIQSVIGEESNPRYLPGKTPR